MHGNRLFALSYSLILIFSIINNLLIRKLRLNQGTVLCVKSTCFLYKCQSNLQFIGLFLLLPSNCYRCLYLLFSTTFQVSPILMTHQHIICSFLTNDNVSGLAAVCSELYLITVLSCQLTLHDSVALSRAEDCAELMWMPICCTKWPNTMTQMCHTEVR